MPKMALPILASPLIRRVAWHIRRVGGQLDRRFFISLGEGIIAIVAIAAVLITLLEKPPTLESLLRLVQLGGRDGPRPGQRGLRDLAGWPGRRLVAYPVRRRHARHDHRRAGRDGHRFPAQGGPGIGRIRPSGPHRRVRLEQHRPRPDRRAARRRLQAEDRRPRRPRQEPRRRRASTSSAATRPTRATWSGPAWSRRRRRSSSRSTAPTRPTCTRS